VWLLVDGTLRSPDEPWVHIQDEVDLGEVIRPLRIGFRSLRLKQIFPSKIFVAQLDQTKVDMLRHSHI
jgi:hypothetical protein